MPLVQIKMLGRVEFRVDSHDVMAGLRPCTRSLLTFCAMHGTTLVGRDRIATQLWRELPASRATRALNTALWRLRESFRQIGDNPSDFIESGLHGIGLSPRSDYDSDIACFEALHQAVSVTCPDKAEAPLIDQASKAEHIYRGDFLPDQFDDWCLVPREALRNRFLVIKEFAVLASMAREDWRNAIEQAQSILAIDPLQERAHRWLIRCYAHGGDRLRAKSQLAHCSELLMAELGVEPLPETIAAAHGDLAGSRTGIAHTPAHRSTRIGRIMLSLDAARDQLQVLDSELRNRSG